MQLQVDYHHSHRVLIELGGGWRGRKRSYPTILSTHRPLLALHIYCHLILRADLRSLTYNSHFTGEEIETQKF